LTTTEIWLNLATIEILVHSAELASTKIWPNIVESAPVKIRASRPQTKFGHIKPNSTELILVEI